MWRERAAEPSRARRPERLTHTLVEEEVGGRELQAGRATAPRQADQLTRGTRLPRLVGVERLLPCLGRPQADDV
jgi:hypothetical protein